MDTIVLSYGDSLLLESDVRLLDSSQWINDKLIGFAFEYFENELYSSDEISFLHPSLVQLVKMSPAIEAKLIVEPLKLNLRSLIFVPLSDNESTSAGGTHWSLLVCDMKSKNILLFDSLSVKQQLPKEISQKFSHILSFDCGNVIPSSSPTQTNSHDCGVYVIAIAEYICEQFLQNNSLNFCLQNMVSHITPSYVQQKRVELKNLIKKLASK